MNKIAVFHWYSKFSLNIYSNLQNKGLRWLIMFISSRFCLVRDIVALWETRPSQVMQQDPSLVYSIDPTEEALIVKDTFNTIARQLNETGIYQGLQLNQRIISEIVSFAKSTAMLTRDIKPAITLTYASKKEIQASLGEQILNGDYPNPTQSCLAIHQLENHPILHRIATDYLNREAIHQETSLWWAFKSDRNPLTERIGPENFHYDLDDYRSVSFFFYLTDVTPKSGAHLYVKGSHRRKKIKYQLSLLSRNVADTEIVQYYSSQTIETICGNAGFGFAEDSYGFHRIELPTTEDRLMLKIRFGFHRYLNNSISSEPTQNCASPS
ncbi:MAG TPA: hypothetical protein V6D19_14160 [Stenomitos sp.]